MRKLPRKAKRWRGSAVDWPVMIVTGCIVVMSAVLVGSVLSSFIYGLDRTSAATSVSHFAATPKTNYRAR